MSLEGVCKRGPRPAQAQARALSHYGGSNAEVPVPPTPRQPFPLLRCLPCFSLPLPFLAGSGWAAVWESGGPSGLHPAELAGRLQGLAGMWGQQGLLVAYLVPMPVEDPPHHNSLRPPRGAEPAAWPPLPRTAFPCTYLSTSSHVSPRWSQAPGEGRS